MKGGQIVFAQLGRSSGFHIEGLNKTLVREREREKGREMQGGKEMEIDKIFSSDLKF